MLQVSRYSNLKIPKKIDAIETNSNNVEDIVVTQKAIATANNKMFNEEQVRKSVEEDKDI